ncbi:DUF3318 domain-containing protein [Geminocystis sp. NIES-3709]|uniref:DUF3318 domain-containing protein n=1 Tax=Geminocystis sp. NIES-3709 TaxID=1617448 RepID=UPI0005FC9FA0|nr:DUF3318 domain-containing protein [Geminocystis sp. NIES-3709]BAQ66724.1 hypothetical protein GM3709_3489 [Geminocystis sp. NIES-3709]
MSIEQEISRLQDLMPASGRICCRIISKPQQTEIITTIFPPPWQLKNRPIYINFDLWRKLSVPQRDLLFLRTVALLLGVKWLKLDIYQGIILSAFFALIFELVNQDIVGVVVSGSLFSIALNQIWKRNRSLEKEIEADEGGIKVAVRRGYSTPSAIKYLSEAIENLPRLESRRGLSFTELLRLQNLNKKVIVENIS